jgi:hypothetical protein
MIGRWFALAMMLVTIAFVGIFVGAVLWPPKTVTSTDRSRGDGSAPDAKRLTGRAGAWTVTAEITQGPAGSVAIIVSAADSEARRAAAPVRPTAVLRMIGMESDAQPVLLVQDTSGRWRGSGRLAMDGRWSLQVSIDGANVSLPFEAASR